MDCTNCAAAVESDSTKTSDPMEAKQYKDRLDSEDVRGEYALDEVGSENEDGNTIYVRIYICANCAVPQEARTYTHP